MSNPIFLKYFTQSDQKRISVGFTTIDDEIKNEAERLKAILITRKIKGGNQKGYFRYKEAMPLTVSFTGTDLEALDNFFIMRSKCGFAVLKSRIPSARPVMYKDAAQLSLGYRDEDKWRIDLVRAPEECEVYSEDFIHYQEEFDDFCQAQRPYDFRWENEWRLKVPESGISFKRLDFVLVPGEVNCKRVRELYGQETYDVHDHIKRVDSYRRSHQGRNPPLEEMIGKHFQLLQERIKKARPKEGVIVLPEVVEAAWDEIRRSAREIKQPLPQEGRSGF